MCFKFNYRNTWIVARHFLVKHGLMLGDVMEHCLATQHFDQTQTLDTTT